MSAEDEFFILWVNYSRNCLNKGQIYAKKGNIVQNTVLFDLAFIRGCIYFCIDVIKGSKGYLQFINCINPLPSRNFGIPPRGKEPVEAGDFSHRRQIGQTAGTKPFPPGGNGKGGMVGIRKVLGKWERG